MRLVKFTVGGVALLVVLFVALAYALPREVVVARSEIINAPAADVYAIVNGFERFPEWSPWAALDPEQHTELRGPRSGPGAVFVWASDNPEVGTGRLEVVDVDPGRRVTTTLAFDDFPPAISEFTLQPRGEEATLVTWSLHLDLGHHPVFRWLGLFFDGMVGPDYERGLANLKALAESS